MRFSLMKIAQFSSLDSCAVLVQLRLSFLGWRLGMTIAAKPLIVRLLKDLLAIIGLCSEGRFDGLTTNG